jgi:hypothetical protein
MILIPLFERDLFKKNRFRLFQIMLSMCNGSSAISARRGADRPSRANSDAAALLRPGAVGAIM